jgi:hypothetical protein
MRSSALASHGPSNNVHCNPPVDTYRTPQQHTSLLHTFLLCICSK